MNVPTTRSSTAGAVEVRPVSRRADVKTFIRLPFHIYADDPAWIAPLDRDVQAALSPSHPFHEHAQLASFLAWRDGRAVGRITAIHNRAHNDFYGEAAGFFGLFECLDDQEAASALLHTAEAWLRERGLTVVRGPFNLSTNDELWSPGILIEGFERPPVVMMGHSRPWYRRLVETAGYDKCKDVLSYWVDAERIDIPAMERTANRIRERAGVTLRPLDMRRLRSEIDLIQDVYNTAWEANWGFVPMSRHEIEHMAKALRPVVNPNLCLIVEKEGEAVGFALGLPDYNQALRRVRGRLFPLGFIRFLLDRRRIDAARAVTLGLKPAYRGRGLDAMLILNLFLEGIRTGQPRGECSWILEDNVAMRRGIERVGGVADKTYRIYEKSLHTPAS